MKEGEGIKQKKPYTRNTERYRQQCGDSRREREVGVDEGVKGGVRRGQKKTLLGVMGARCSVQCAVCSL